MTPLERIEPVIALLQELPAQARQALADVINKFAHQETDPDRQLTAWDAPQTLGLLSEPR